MDRRTERVFRIPGNRYTATSIKSGAFSLEPLPESRSVPADIDHPFGESLWGFLRQIVADAAFDKPVRIFAGKLPGVGTGLEMRCTVGIPFKRNGGHSDNRKFRKALLQIVILRFAFSQSEPPAVIMNDDAHVIRIVEGCCATLECGVVEFPFRRSDLPDELVKIMPVFVIR